MDLHIIPLEDDDHCIIYRPLLGLAFVGNRAMADLCLKIANGQSLTEDWYKDEALVFLSAIGFFLSDNIPSSPDFIATTAVLLLTNRCQLRCKYCYAAAGEALPRGLLKESGNIAIDFAFSQAKEHERNSFRVDFHGGGEPSLEWRTLQQLTRYARNKDLLAYISLTSNAVWSEFQSNWIMENIDSLSISMDGSPETQNRQRPLLNHNPSSPLVMRNLKRLDDHGYSSYGIRMTVCHPWTQLSEDVKFILENTNCRSIQVEPAFNVQRGAHTSPDEDQFNRFTRAYLAAYDTAVQYGAKLIYSGARPGVMSNIFCTAPYNAIVVNPDNNLVACYEIVDNYHPLSSISTFGKIQENTLVIDHKTRAYFYGLLQERFDKVCRDCFCRWTCAGDCYTRAFSEDGGHLAAGARCSMNREITKNIILNLIYQQQGVWHVFSNQKISEEA